MCCKKKGLVGTESPLSVCLSYRVWTTFEYSLTKCPDVMRDRHLDQLVMCAVYVMSKVHSSCEVCVCPSVCVLPLWCRS